MASQPIYRFYAYLADYQPAIWRRFEVLGNITMARLAYILMTLFEMQASHLFHFAVPLKENTEKQYRALFAHLPPEELEEYLRLMLQDTPDEDQMVELPWEEEDELSDQEAEDASLTQMRHIFAVPGSRATLFYDYGDGWEVQITLEEIREDARLPGRELPRVLEGEGYGIIEDCGGPGGLAELAEAFRKKRGQHYQDMREWLGVDQLDLTSFDLEDMNFRLKKVPRIYRDLYEHDLEPTRQSMNILTRKYLSQKG